MIVERGDLGGRGGDLASRVAGRMRRAAKAMDRRPLRPVCRGARNLLFLAIVTVAWLSPASAATAAAPPRAIHAYDDATARPPTGREWAPRPPATAPPTTVAPRGVSGSLATPRGAGYGRGLVAGPAAMRQDIPLPLPPILPPVPIDPQFLKDAFVTLALGLLRDADAALRAPLDAWLASPLNFVSQTPPAGTYASDVVAGLWRAVRAAANALLAVVVVAGGLNVMLKDRLGLPYHEAAELLPRVAVGALLANTSLWLAQLAIDLNNGLCGLIGGTALPGWQQAGQPLQTIASAVAALLYLVTALFLLLQMLMRLALIDVLIVVAPLALLCWTLPQTQGWARRWSAAFTGAVFTQFVQIVALKLGAELFTDLTPASGVGEAVLPSLLGIALLVLTIRIPSLMSARGAGSGLMRFIVYQQLRGR